MILFAVAANALMIAAMFMPRLPSWQLYCLLYGVPFVIYFVFIAKSNDTSPEKRYNAQRLVLIIASVIAAYLMFTRYSEMNVMIAALICGTLFVRRNYYAGD